MRLKTNFLYKPSTFKSWAKGCQGLYVMAGDLAVKVTHAAVNKTLKNAVNVIGFSMQDTEADYIFIYITEIKRRPE